MIRTTDPDEMKREISNLKARGGGDPPEMCLSGLQVSNLRLFPDYYKGVLIQTVVIQNELIGFIILFLQLALTGSPAYSHIYVFTDATAKDISLKDTIIALVRSSKSTVNTD